MSIRLRIFVTHPVQYHVPLWRALAAHPALDVRVFYFSDHSIRGGIDKGFGRAVAWDVDLEAGYRHEFLSRDANLDRPQSVAISDVHALLRRERPDWILISGYTHAFERQLAQAARRHGAKLLMRGEFSELSDGPRPVWKQLLRAAYLRWFYGRVDRFCFPGVMARAHLRKHGVAEARTFFSPYSVNDALFERTRQELSRGEARRSLGLPDDRFVFLFSGKLIPRKDPFALLEAMQGLGARERAGLVVLGDGELAPEFRRRAEALLGDRFVFPGFVNQSELGRYFRAADALVMPSRQETWGLVVNEAMHYGLPVIVSDRVGCHPDLVQPGVTGFVYPWGDNGALRRHMQAMLDAPQTARDMGCASLARIAGYTIAESARGVFAALGVDIAASAVA
jgi:glycosyltransferase involved in cell wall biosynthesis